MSRLIMGKNCILEVLKIAPERIKQVYTSHKPGEDGLYEKLLQEKVPIRTLSKQELTQLVHSDSHQSYVAEVYERKQLDLKDFIANASDRSMVIMLDSIFDPQNLGAILRAAECFGVDLVVFSKNRGSDITPVTTKTSAGASELVPILKVSNLAETMKAFQKGGYWSVACEGKEGSTSLYDFTFPEKTLLIFGSEGKGVQPLLSKNADFHLSIPMLGHIDSLNVSQAAAVFLNQWRAS
ncbi:MAG: 23S rRNA (guanosine(2251)-2'-O)-methyltransferase RlmB [Chlamydiales bacterium]